MTDDWTAACASGNLEMVRAHLLHAYTPQDILSGFHAAIRGEHADVARFLLPRAYLLPFSSPDVEVAIHHERTHVLGELLLPWFECRCDQMACADQVAQRRVRSLTYNALQAGYTDVLNVLLGSSLRSESPHNLACEAIWAHQLTSLVCITNHRAHTAAFNPTSFMALPIVWSRLCKHARHVDTVLLVESSAFAAGMPLSSVDWCHELENLVGTNTTHTEMRSLICLCAQRIKDSRTEVCVLTQHIIRSIDTLVMELSLSLPTEEIKHLECLGTLHILCNSFDHEKWWTQCAVGKLVRRVKSPILDLAYHAGWLTRAHVVNSRVTPDERSKALAVLDEFQIMQHLRRVALDRTADLPRVLGDIVMGY
jgi:hypothetical protein